MINPLEYRLHFYGNDLKKCNKCQEIKNKELFYNSKCHADKLCSPCKQCSYKKNKEYIQNNKEEYIQKQKEWIIKNKEKCQESRNKWAIKNKEKIKEKNKRYKQKYKEKIKQQRHDYYVENKKEYIIKVRKWKENNSDKVKASARKGAEKYRKKNPLKHTISNSISYKLKKRNLTKNNRKTWINILPYSINELKTHLEALFEEDMSWENYGCKNGQWSLDHIIPDSYFNYNSVDDIEFKKCWALDNLQPMWHYQNISKGNRYIGKYKPD